MCPRPIATFLYAQTLELCPGKKVAKFPFLDLTPELMVLRVLMTFVTFLMTLLTSDDFVTCIDFLMDFRLCIDFCNDFSTCIDFSNDFATLY